MLVQQSNKGCVRIIGGKWRSRRIHFIPFRAIKPTTDARRETLFNWLTPKIINANCCDLFAGSGALGFEAISRGASNVVMIDILNKIIRQLIINAKSLFAENVEFHCLSLPKELSKIPKQRFDVVFLDPPFYHNLIKSTCEKLICENYLAKNAYIYIESEKNLLVEGVVPNSWVVLHKKISNHVASYLFLSEN
jgi:16S rRNA (guanine966-N2)-methyltransferase